MTTPPQTGRNLLFAVLTAVLAAAEAGLAAIGWLVWTLHASGHATGAEAATFSLLGVSAVAGAALLLVTVIVFARGIPGHRIAQVAAGLAGLRVAAVIVALIAIAVAFGAAAVFAGLFAAFGAGIAVADTFVAWFVSGLAARRTRQE